ncbi:prolyl oligopeptidase family serine peptidase [Microbacterium koreense]|uniref:Prolyl oligopeptidase family serine peptidase n=1 Tax=Microbacterium koreense TaxID=323761 RepID=A0ABW2ZTU8_9MICO
MTIPYGAWPSPLTASAVSAATPRIEGARFVADDLWWGETRPDEGGRSAVRRRGITGEIEDVLPAPWSARSRVHEYGGGSWTATDAGDLVFVEKSDQRVRRLSPGGAPIALTPEDGDTRFGGLTWQHGQLLAVRERHTDAPVPIRDIVAIPADGSAASDPSRIRSLAAGSDFVAQPALSPDGTRLAWIAWDHPAMPWDRTELRVGRLGADGVTTWTVVAGGDTAPLQPEWTPDGLVFVDDPTGRWNLRRWTEAGIADLSPADADTGGGLWVLGLRWFGHLADGRIVAVRTNGADRIVIVHRTTGAATTLDVPVVAGAVIEDVSGTRVLISGSATTDGPGLWLVDVSDGSTSVVRGGESPWGSRWMPRPRAVTFTGPHGDVHAFDYPPTNPDVNAPEGELPPYVVFVHGGPTSHSGPAASGKIAYLTSRGIGVLDVNYGGSTGYGREYRERLLGQWGVVDVDDVAAAARGLADAGLADPARIAIAGGSAGGWTVLAGVARTDAFSAGISRYGVGDARTLAADTHDFEARYLDGLIGPLPDAEEVYLERSPLTRPELFRVPLLLLQGSEDAVVPPAQSEAVRDALAGQGVAHKYVLYEGEAHGFRRGDTVVHALETELAFLGAVFGFTPPDVPAISLD